MNMRNKKFSLRRSGIILLAAVTLFAIVLPLDAQQRNRRTRKKEIKVPETALECPYTKEAIEKKLNHFNTWINAWAEACEKKDFNQLRSSWEKLLKKPQKYMLSDMKPAVFVKREQPDEKKKKQERKRKKQEEVEAPADSSVEQLKAEGTFYYLTAHDFQSYYGPFGIFLKFPALTDDLQEATRFDKEAFLRYDSVIRNLKEVLEKMDDLRQRNASMADFKKVFETEFKPALRAAVRAYELLQQTKRMTSEKRIALEEKNRERRRKAFIAKAKRESEQKKDQSEQEQ